MVRWRLLTLGGLATFLAGTLWRVRSSQWVQGNARFVADALEPWTLALQATVLVGAATIAVAFFYGKWFLALVFGVLFALGAYFLTFVI